MYQRIYRFCLFGLILTIAIAVLCRPIIFINPFEQILNMLVIIANGVN